MYINGICGLFVANIMKGCVIVVGKAMQLDYILNKKTKAGEVYLVYLEKDGSSIVCYGKEHSSKEFKTFIELQTWLACEREKNKDWIYTVIDYGYYPEK